MVFVQNVNNVQNPYFIIFGLNLEKYKNYKYNSDSFKEKHL